MKRLNHGPLFLLCAAVLWSFGGVLSKYIPWNALTIACLRGLLSAMVGFAALGTFRLRITRTKLLTAICYFLVSILFIYANKLTSAGNAIVLQNTSPIYIILFSMLIYKQRPTKLEIGTVILLLSGVILSCVQDIGSGKIWGNLLAIICGVFFAAIFFTSQLPGANALESVILGNLFYLFCIPFLFFDSQFMHSSGTSILCILFMGIFQMGLSWVFFSKGIQQTPALGANFITMLEPVLSPCWAFLFLIERMGVLSLLGGAIVISTIISYNAISIYRTKHQ